MKLNHIIPIIFLLLVSSVSASITEDIPIDRGIADPLVGFSDWRLDDADLEHFMDTQILFQGKEYDLHDELLLTYMSPSIETSLTSFEDDYEDNIFMEAKKKTIYYMLMIDDIGLNISKATEREPFKVNFLGKELEIIDVPDGYDDRFTAIVGDRYYMKTGDSVMVDGKQITLVNVGSGGQVEIDVDGYQEMINSNTIKLVNGIEIYLRETFYDNIMANRAAVLYIGNPAVKTYRNNDPYIGEDENRPNWKWVISNLGSEVDTTIDEGNIFSEYGYLDTTAISGPYIGIYNNFRKTSDTDNPVGIGECYSLPNNYAQICFDSLNVPDTDYLDVTIEYVDDAPLDDSGYPGMSAAEKAIYINAPGEERFVLSINESAEYNEYFMDVGDTVVINENQVTLVNVGSGGGVIVDVNGYIDTIIADSTKIIAEVEITNIKTFYANTKSERAATLRLGDIIVDSTEDISTSEIWVALVNNSGSIETRIFYRDIEQVPDIVYFGTFIGNSQINYMNTNLDFEIIKSQSSPVVDLVLYSGEQEMLTVAFDIVDEEISNQISLDWVWDLVEPEVVLNNKDENHRTKYGYIIENPIYNRLMGDRVLLKIPGDRVQANVIIKSNEVPIPPEEEPLIVDISRPKNSSTINTNSVWLEVRTNKNAVCSYLLQKCNIIEQPEPEPEPEPIDCSIYNGMTCQEIIDYTNDVLERPYAYCECGEILDMCTTNISSLVCPGEPPKPIGPGYGACGVNAIPINIPTTDGLHHSILIEDLFGSWDDDIKIEAELSVSCTHPPNEISWDSINFLVDLKSLIQTEYYINLDTGWNLFSIPLSQEDTKVESVINDIQDKVEIIYSYEQRQWKGWAPDCQVNSLTNLEAGKGYFIKLKEPAILYVNGTIGVGEPPVIPTFNVYNGWNLIGYYGTEDTLALMALRNVWDKYSAIWTLFDNKGEQALQGSLKGFGMDEFNQDLKKTHGYWLYMQEDGIIVPTN